MAAHKPNPLEPQKPRLLAPTRDLGPTSLLPTPAPVALSATPDALALLKALRRRWLLAGTLGVMVGAIAGAAAWFLLPSKYNAFALLQVKSQSTSPVEREISRDNFATFLRTSAGRLKSRDVLIRALGQDQVRHLRLIKKHPETLSALTWLEENMKVDIQEGSELLTVSLPGEDPNDLVLVVNAIVKSYLDIFNNEEKALKRIRFERLQIQLESAKEVLRAKVAEKESLQKKLDAKDPATLMQNQASIQAQLLNAQHALLNHEFELQKKLAELASVQGMKKTLDSMPPPPVPDRELLEADATAKQFQADLLKYERAVEKMRRSGHPDGESVLEDFKAQVANLKRKVAERLVALRVEHKQSQGKRHVNELDTTLQSLQTTIGPLENFVKKWHDKVETLTKDSEMNRLMTKRYDFLDSEIAAHEKNAAQLLGAKNQAKNEDEAEPRIVLRGDAELQTRDTKKRTFLIALTPVFALIATMLVVAWWEFMARRIHGPDEVSSGLAIRVVGAVPELPDPKRRRNSDPQIEELYRHNLVESIDAIRTTLLRNADADNTRVIMVTSALSGEGKTTLASNLAMSLARAGRKTLLLDCDLRSPAAHQLFEQTLQPGFSEAVLQEVELPDAVRPTTTDDNLFLLPAGHWDREVIQELAKTGLSGIFEKLREEFEFIIIDSHPVLLATDSLLLGQQADAVLFSLMRDVSQIHHVQTACQQFDTLGIRVFGAVVNGVPVKAYGKSYQYAQQPVAA